MNTILKFYSHASSMSIMCARFRVKFPNSVPREPRSRGEFSAVGYNPSKKIVRRCRRTKQILTQFVLRTRRKWISRVWRMLHSCLQKTTDSRLLLATICYQCYMVARSGPIHYTYILNFPWQHKFQPIDPS